MTTAAGREAPRVPSRDELVGVFEILPFVQADRSTLETAADHLRRVFRQPGRDDLSLTLRMPTGAWVPEPEANCASELSKLAVQFGKVQSALRQLPSSAWQAMDGAELAALQTFYNDEQIQQFEEIGVPRVRGLLEDLLEDGEFISRTLAWASAFVKAGGEKYRTHEFAYAAAYSFSLLTGKDPTRRHNPYKNVEHGPFFEFVEALRLAFNHPASTATLTKSAVQRWRRMHAMDNRKPKSR